MGLEGIGINTPEENPNIKYFRTGDGIVLALKNEEVLYILTVEKKWKEIPLGDPNYVSFKMDFNSNGFSLSEDELAKKSIAPLDL